MKYLTSVTAIIIALCLFSCTQANKQTLSKATIDTTGKVVSSTEPNEKSDQNEVDKAEIQTLIRSMLNWSEAKNSFNLLPALTNGQDSICIGFDLKKLELNLETLKTTGFFSAEFIDNYKQIILTLDKKIRSKEFAQWPVDELPTFGFTSDANPWCLCQDVPYDKPNPWNLVEVDARNLNTEKGELYWKWGKPELNGAPGWKDFTYKFKVKKEAGKWKIAYLQGFDFEESIKMDGKTAL